MEKVYQHYGMEAAIQGVTETTKGWLKQYIQELLEQNNTHFTQKADVLAYAILGVDDKIRFVDEQITSLQDYKKSLKQSIDIAKEVAAEVFASNGINKLDGALVSSLTITKGTSSSKLEINAIEDEASLIEAGYYTKVLDTKRIISEYMTGTTEQVEQLKEYCRFQLVQKDIPAKLRINKRKAVNNITPPSIDIPNIDDDAA